MNQTILFYGDEEVLKKIAKKGSETDISYYNTKMGEDIVTFLSIFKFPERLQTLLNAASVSNKAMIAVNQVDKGVGEFLLTLEYYAIKDLGVVGDDAIYSSIKEISKSLRIDIHRVSATFESFLNFVSIPLEEPDRETLVIIDQTFSVKGVGTVSLGFLIGGAIKKHSKLKTYPSKKEIDVKSIQMMDVDVEEAVPFSRVGLAFRNVEVEDLPKGSILYDREDMRLVDDIRLNIRVNPMIRTTASVGDKIQLNFLFNNVNAEISDITGGQYLIDVSRKVPILNSIFSLSNLNSTPRILGAGEPES